MSTSSPIARLASALLDGSFSHAFIDADDTLWYDGRYFRVLRQHFFQACEASAVHRSAAKEALRQATSAVGLGERGFVAAVCEAAEGVGLDSKNKLHLGERAEEFLHHPIELLPSVEVALEMLRPVQLVLLTKGDYAEQIAKLDCSRLRSFFSEIVVVQRKELSTLSDLLAARALRSDRVISIGNSVQHDVLPAIEAGATAVWLDHPDNLHGRNASAPELAYCIDGWAPLVAACSSLCSRPATSDLADAFQETPRK